MIPNLTGELAAWTLGDWQNYERASFLFGLHYDTWTELSIPARFGGNRIDRPLEGALDKECGSAGSGAQKFL